LWDDHESKKTSWAAHVRKPDRAMALRKSHLVSDLTDLCQPRIEADRDGRGLCVLHRDTYLRGPDISALQYHDAAAHCDLGAIDGLTMPVDEGSFIHSCHDKSVALGKSSCSAFCITRSR